MNKESNTKEKRSKDTMGQRIKNRRIEMGYTQEVLAEMLFVKKATISKYEKDQRDIPVSVLVRMADILQISPDYLIRGNFDWIEDIKQVLIHISDPKLQKVAKMQMVALTDICK